MNLHTFFQEKDFEIQTYSVEANGNFHIIQTDVVIEHILATKGEEREFIEKTLLQLDVLNGNFHHFFKHLAQCLAMQF